MRAEDSARPAPGARALGAGAAVLALLVLGACASAPAPRASAAAAVELPAAWSEPGGGAAATPLARWWLRFDDPALVALVEQALRISTRVRSAQTALVQAQALRDGAAAALWPGLGLSASAQRSVAGGHITGNRFQVGASASWDPDLFGGRRSALRAGDAAAQASAASLGEVQVAIAAEVGLNYILLRGSQERLAIAEGNLASQLETLQITQWRQQAGLVTALEAEQAQSATEQTRAQLPALRKAIAQTRHALALLVGQAPQAASPLLDPLDTAGVLPRSGAELVPAPPAETLRQRADVRAAEWQLAAALARVAQADAARWPSFSLGGTLGLGAATLGALGSGAAVVGSLLGSVSWAVLDGGAANAQLRAQQAAAEQARIAYQAAVLTALQEVEDAFAALRASQERLLVLRRAAVLATSAAGLARQRFGSGLVDFQTVLETQRSQLGTQDGVAGAAADVAADQIRLYRALGGGWRDADDGAPPPPEARNRTPRP